ncbi:melatonin receptor type 1C-like [Stylophora pistillata]|uniref:melatonin receptor type 1C-like n=1 Tax=Stylophora pistillata TaxID=50429 RepID=UPI000C03E753|nr:melatonin receptor type 1C-like [Stylophora pistillata]
MCAHQGASSDLHTALRNRCTETVVTESLVTGCLIIAGFLSGLIVCLAMYRNVRLRYTIHIYILWYAIIDLVTSLLVMPFTLGVLIKGEWISSTSACQFQGYAISVLGIFTVLTMTLTAVDRYMASSRLSQYWSFFKRTHICIILAVFCLFSFAIPLSSTLDRNNFVFHPGYGICRTEAKNETYLRASILKIIIFIVPSVVIATCYYRARSNIQQRYKDPKLWAQEERMENLNIWKEEENKTKLLAAFTLGTLFFWVPGYACDVADAFTHEKCLPRSIYLLSTLLFNVSHCVKPLIVAAMDGDFAMEFKRILKFRKTRRVTDVNAQGSKLGGDPKFMPETRKYYCETGEDDTNLTKANESNV